jgi:ABC-2 type transport system ATP-binding protein
MADAKTVQSTSAKNHGQPNAQMTLSVRNLQKKLGGKPIIKGLSFDVKPGEIFGFLGPNGSGKTTTIRMLVGLIKADAGQIHVQGFDVQKQHFEAMKRIGCIVENPEMYPYLSGWDNLLHFARMLPGITEQRILDCVRRVGLDNRIYDKVRTYSLGMKQRLGIAQALLGSPKLLILDEPTNGLDPQGIKDLRIFIRELAEEGMSVFISSHLLGEVQLMCDRVAIISHGEVIRVGEVEQLIQQANVRVVWQVDQIESVISVFEQSGKVQVLSTDVTVEPNQIVTMMNEELVPELNRALITANVNVYGIQRRQPSLEELFLELTEGESID